MNTSPEGLAIIKRFEGFEPRRYRCPAGKWTIGYGHVIRKSEWPTLADATLTPADAERLLGADLIEFEAMVRGAVAVPLTQGQFDAMVSIVYNVGPGSADKDGILRLKSGRPSTLLRKLNAADYAGAAAEFPRWKYSGGKILAGLERRRAAEKTRFES